jgi:hypothetical protein
MRKLRKKLIKRNIGNAQDMECAPTLCRHARRQCLSADSCRLNQWWWLAKLLSPRRLARQAAGPTYTVQRRRKDKRHRWDAKRNTGWMPNVMVYIPPATDERRSEVGQQIRWWHCYRELETTDQIDDVGDNVVEKGGKILFYYPRDSRTMSSSYGSFSVLYPWGRYILIGRKTLHLHIN